MCANYHKKNFKKKKTTISMHRTKIKNTNKNQAAETGFHVVCFMCQCSYLFFHYHRVQNQNNYASLKFDSVDKYSVVLK